MDKLSLTLVQTSLHWEDKAANFALFENLLSKCGPTDLILLPEMFSTGFSMRPAGLHDSPEGESLEWLRRLAAEKNAAVSGSAIIKEEGRFYNRLFFVKPDGNYHTYDKKHLFTLAGEEKVYSGGTRHLIVEYKGWKIMPLVCYDLRFPVWCRNTQEVDLQYFVANWPERRSFAWRSLLRARAIENMCFVAGLNRVGDDGNGVAHSGDSAVLDELGEAVLEIPASAEKVATVSLSKGRMLESRERFQFLADRDFFEITGTGR